ncbi:MAG TPA: aspartate carbamoyltransferase [Candidatus Gracilibacteria bacterium]|nr:aspartate carbamoyltransferase [Candidatus Gracilibacteria bacterium]
MNFQGSDILTAKNLSKADIERIMEVAEGFLPYAKKEKQSDLLNGKILAALFYEPSTRTRLSFETAMLRLGGRTVSVAGMEGSSLMKGETLHDTACVIENFADVIAVRHPQPGSAAEMADAIGIPVLNAGDGAGEHPTQALLDVFTMLQERGKVEGLKIAFVGDLKFGRTVHSLSYLLSHFGVKLYFVSPDALRMPDDIMGDLKERKMDIIETESLEEALKHVDVCYMTRIQQERFTDPQEYQKFKHAYVLTKELVEKYNGKMTIMHPLPRVGEISMNVDELEGASYFRQVGNGVALRMALLALVLGKV